MRASMSDHTWRWALSATIAVLLLPQHPSMAFKADANQPYVATSDDGRCYAKSIPRAVSGDVGVTRIYAVENSADRLLETHEWYSRRLFLSCDFRAPGTDDIFLVRMLWPLRGERASADKLAMAIYRNGNVVKEYSALDIAGTPGNVRKLGGAYDLFDASPEFKMSWGIFRARRADGLVLDFNTITGAMVTYPPPPEAISR